MLPHFARPLIEDFLHRTHDQNKQLFTAVMKDFKHAVGRGFSMSQLFAKETEIWCWYALFYARHNTMPGMLTPFAVEYDDINDYKKLYDLHTYDPALYH